MKYLIWVLVVISFSACAIGKLEDAADALEKAEIAIGDLNVAECISACDPAAKACFDNANITCVNNCEFSDSSCRLYEDSCLDLANDVCAIYNDSSYYDCMDAARDDCDQNCEKKFSDCTQDCGNILKECLFGEDNDLIADSGFSQCVADCIKEMEDTLKDIKM